MALIRTNTPNELKTTVKIVESSPQSSQTFSNLKIGAIYFFYYLSATGISISSGGTRITSSAIGSSGCLVAKATDSTMVLTGGSNPNFYSVTEVSL